VGYLPGMWRDFAAICAATARVLPGDLPTTTTSSPRPASIRAAAAPIPSLRPVTTTTLRSPDVLLMRKP
jgi:hypothetical protein